MDLIKVIAKKRYKKYLKMSIKRKKPFHKILHNPKKSKNSINFINNASQNNCPSPFTPQHYNTKASIRKYPRAKFLFHSIFSKP